MNKPSIDINNLPNDVNELKSFIVEFATDAEKIIQSKEAEIKILHHKLQKQLLARFAAKSEKIPEQGDLFDEPVEPSQNEQQDISAAEEELSVTSYNRRKPGRKPLPKELPREQIIHDLNNEEKVCVCGCQLTKFGEDKREQLEYIPAQVKVIEHIRVKYSCKKCESIKAGPLPCTPIPKSIATPGLLSEIIVSKYVDHNPLYRQEKKFQRMGVDIARKTLSSWMIKCGYLLEPLIPVLKQHMLSGKYFQVDETTQQVLNEPDRANTKKSYLWVFKGGPPNQHGVIYEYHPSRSGNVAEAFLADFVGELQCDGFSGVPPI